MKMNIVFENIISRRDDFPSLKQEINGYPLAYLDGPGGTQVPQSVIDAVSNYYYTSNANCHGNFITSQRTDEVLITQLDHEANRGFVVKTHKQILRREQWDL